VKKNENAKEIAVKLLGITGIPANLKKLIQHFGVKAVSIEMPMSVSGMVVPDPYQERFVLAVNNRMNYYHRRFTVAHELWHIICRVDSIWYRWQINANNNGQEERQANIFAAELLMPEKAVKERFESGERVLTEYCNFFKVSKPAMEIRLFKELGFKKEEFSE